MSFKCNFKQPCFKCAHFRGDGRGFKCFAEEDLKARAKMTSERPWCDCVTSEVDMNGLWCPEKKDWVLNSFVYTGLCNGCARKKT